MAEARADRGTDWVYELLTDSSAVWNSLDDTDEVAWRIVTAAREQIEAVGWKRSTMDDIARRARLGRATVYRKFPTKTDIGAAVVAAEVRGYYADRAALPDQPSANERIAQSVIFTVEWIRTNAMLQRLLDTEPEAIVPALTRDAGPLFRLVAQLSIPGWQRELLGDRPPTAEQLRHFHTAAELHTRIALSFVLTRDTTIALDTPEQIRWFANQYFAPLLLNMPA
ncbi:TetR/AcrR family transcriptional regulator [Williamsia maris]|uniref:Transcriptional regulator, TetR family n=1 Tax=Williamsia maris TaxID=72806 RepID=A0ABT1HJJ5_9NOCA|nr:TetR/AcrR family transcriptional regulator [Williamsia maris]MCP2178105.1 transcriptional regulator, TetR family [Williamsia maris]